MRTTTGAGAHAALLMTMWLCLPAPAAGQSARPPAGGVLRGDSVRVGIMGADPVAARVTGWRADTLVMAVHGMDAPWSLAARDIQTLSRYQALSNQAGFRRGAGMGLGVGLFTGAAVGLALYTTGITHDPDGPPAEQLMASVLRFAGLGTAAGVLVGGFLGGRNPGWGWVGVKLRTGS